MVDKTKNRSGLQASEKKDSMHLSLAKPEVADLIGERLRSFYDDVAKQPVPHHILNLLSKLQAASSSEKKT